MEHQAEEDGRMFPVTDNSATIVDCLMSEIRRLGGLSDIRLERRETK